MIKILLKISKMHCTSCSLLIDSALEELPGVTSSNTSFANQSTQVEFDETKITKEKIIEAIKKEGYQAEL